MWINIFYSCRKNTFLWKFAWNFHNECCSIRKLFSNFVLSQTDRHTESVFHSVLTKKSDSFNVNRGNEQHSFSCLDRFGQNNFAPQFSYLFKCGVKHSFIRFWVLSEPLCRWTKTAPHLNRNVVCINLIYSYYILFFSRFDTAKFPQNYDIQK